MLLYHVLMGLLVIAYVFGSVFDSALGSILGLFSTPSALHLLLDLTILGFYGKSFEERMGSGWFAAVYLVGAMSGGLLSGVSFVGFEAHDVGGAGSGFMALIGSLIAMSPYTWIVAEIVPVPAFLAGVFYIGVKFIIDQSFDVIPLLLGLMLGYIIMASKTEQHPQPQGGWSPPH